VSGLEEMLRQALERVERLEELSEVLRRRYRSLKRRNQLALLKLKDIVAELEAVDYDNPHIETALELLYDIERLLEVVEDE
jgi:uncharacterized protein (UPF0335 family)